MKLKQFAKKHFFTVLLVAFVLYIQIPRWIANSQQRGNEISSQTYRVLNPNSETEATPFPLEKDRSMVIFWATWCAPCKLEMARLKTSVENGAIPANKIFAISSEPAPTIQKFLKENPFPFLFIEAPQLADKLKIEATPTTVFFEKNKIESMSTGISLTGIWRAEFFLD